jgi:hypothetical protein
MTQMANPMQRRTVATSRTVEVMEHEAGRRTSAADANRSNSGSIVGPDIVIPCDLVKKDEIVARQSWRNKVVTWVGMQEVAESHDSTKQRCPEG